MADNIGTHVIAPIVPKDTADTYPTHDDQYGLGGYRTVATIVLRDAIPLDRQKVGMEVYVEATDLVYKLDTTNVTLSPTDWSEREAGAVDSVNSHVGDVVLDKTDIGLDQVDNTSDVNKPVSTATQTAIDLHADLVTGNPHAVTATEVGLGSADNTSDVDKPVSTATQAAIDAHEAKSIFKVYSFIGTASQTVFTGADVLGQTLTYQVGKIFVLRQGVNIDHTDFSAPDGATVTLNKGVQVGDIVHVVAFETFTNSGPFDAYGEEYTIVDSATLTGFSNDYPLDLSTCRNNIIFVPGVGQDFTITTSNAPTDLTGKPILVIVVQPAGSIVLTVDTQDVGLSGDVGEHERVYMETFYDGTNSSLDITVVGVPDWSL